MGSKTVKTEDLKPMKNTDVLPVQDVKLEPIKNLKIEPTKSADSIISKDIESEVTKVMDSISRTNDEPMALEPRIPIGEMGEEEQKLFKEIEEMKSNIQEFESKISKVSCFTLLCSSNCCFAVIIPSPLGKKIPISCSKQATYDVCQSIASTLLELSLIHI